MLVANNEFGPRRIGAIGILGEMPSSGRGHNLVDDDSAHMHHI